MFGQGKAFKALFSIVLIGQVNAWGKVTIWTAAEYEAMMTAQYEAKATQERRVEAFKNLLEMKLPGDNAQSCVEQYQQIVDVGRILVAAQMSDSKNRATRAEHQEYLQGELDTLKADIAADVDGSKGAQDVFDNIKETCKTLSDIEDPLLASGSKGAVASALTNILCEAGEEEQLLMREVIKEFVCQSRVMALDVFKACLSRIGEIDANDKNDKVLQ